MASSIPDTGSRPPGVYRYGATTRAYSQEWVWHTHDFRAFLPEAVANGCSSDSPGASGGSRRARANIWLAETIAVVA